MTLIEGQTRDSAPGRQDPARSQNTEREFDRTPPQAIEA